MPQTLAALEQILAAVYQDAAAQVRDDDELSLLTRVPPARNSGASYPGTEIESIDTGDTGRGSAVPSRPVAELPASSAGALPQFAGQDENASLAADDEESRTDDENGSSDGDAGLGEFGLNVLRQVLADRGDRRTGAISTARATDPRRGHAGRPGGIGSRCRMPAWPDDGIVASGGVRSQIQANDHLLTTVNLQLSKWRKEGTTAQEAVGIADVERALHEIPAGGPTDHSGVANDIAEYLAHGTVPRIRAGAFGRELETQFTVTGFPQDGMKRTLVRLPELTLETDKYRFDTIIEIVENPVNGLAGETSRLAPDRVRQVTAEVSELLTSRAGQGLTIHDIFENFPGATLTVHAETAVLGPLRENMSMYVQHTAGVQVAVMHDFIKLIAAKPARPRAIHHAASALRFGDEVSARFAEAGATSGRANPDVAVVRGFMTLVYTQVAANLERQLSGIIVQRRNRAVAVSRVPLADILNRLPEPVRDFLSRDADWILGVFHRRYAADNSAQLSAAGVLTKSQLLAVSWKVIDGPEHTIGRYLGNALAPLENLDDFVDQRDALDVSTELPEVDDESGGRRDDPLVPLEVRYYGRDRYESLQEAEAWYDELKASVRELDEKAQLLRKLRSGAVTVDAGRAGAQLPDAQREKLRSIGLTRLEDVGRAADILFKLKKSGESPSAVGVKKVSPSTTVGWCVTAMAVTGLVRLPLLSLFFRLFLCRESLRRPGPVLPRREPLTVSFSSVIWIAGAAI